MNVHGDGSAGSPLARRVAVAVVGGTVTIAGIAMIVLPGPAVVVIPLGLSILATEFVWPRRYLRRFRMAAARWKENVKFRVAERASRKSDAPATAPYGACAAPRRMHAPRD
jgi:hypothetical protein